MPNNIKPEVGEYWTIKAGKDSFLYAIIESKTPLSVQYFAPSVKEKCHIFNDPIFPVLVEDLGKKISPPEIKKLGKYRKFYYFE